MDPFTRNITLYHSAKTALALNETFHRENGTTYQTYIYETTTEATNSVTFKHAQLFDAGIVSLVVRILL